MRTTCLLVIATLIVDAGLGRGLIGAENAASVNEFSHDPQSSICASAEALDFGARKQLLVDDDLIDSKTNITRQLGTVKKFGPVVKPTLASDHGGWFGAYHTVLFNPNEGKFQLWYSLGTGRE